MIPQILTNTNLFVDGVSFAGDVPSLTLPTLKVKTQEYRAGGMDAPVLLDVGLEAMEAKFTTNGARREAMKFFGLSDQGAFNGTFRGSFKTQKGGTVPVVATVRGLLKEINPGDWKAGDLAACTYSVAVTYYKLEVEGREMFEIDPANSVSARSTASTSWPPCVTTWASEESRDARLCQTARVAEPFRGRGGGEAVPSDLLQRRRCGRPHPACADRA